MMCRFGVTEISKGDDEHGTAEHVEKGHNTHVHESTADVARGEKEVQI